MALTDTRLKELTTRLRELAQAANAGQGALRDYEAFLEKFSKQETRFVNFKEIITEINNLATAFGQLGASANEVDRVRTELVKLAGTAKATASETRNLAPFGKGAVPVTPQRVAQQRFAQIIRELNLTGQDLVGNQEFQRLYDSMVRAAEVELTSLKSGLDVQKSKKIQKIQTLEASIREQQNLARRASRRLQRLGTGPLEGEERIERARMEGVYYRARDEVARLRDQLQKARQVEQRLTRRIANVGISEDLSAGISMEELQRRQGGGRREGLTIADPQFYKDLEQMGIRTAGLKESLESMGVTADEVASQPITDLSTGITKVTFTTKEGEGAIRKYTAHIDKFGNVLKDQQKRFRTFGDAIVRDTVEVLKWTIAISLVYGPMRKLNDLMREAAEIQESLVDVQIILGEETEKLDNIFQSAVEVANQTSSAVAGVIGGYNEALAATSSVSDEAERLASTQALLRDSMLLAKLSGLEQSKSLDILVGALTQAGLELYEGSKLLDSWVAVSKNANVSLNQLATTYAIVGTAAEDAGIGFDELNAIVGALAEATTLSADEVGNAIRGFISGFQSATAEEQLSRFGIAVRNTEGQVRSFTDLMRELAILRDQGVLSSRDISELSNAIGGGFRRGAQVSALLEAYPRVLELITVSQSAAGDSAEALEIKMSTLQSSITRLQNAFSELAQSLGGEGGALGVLTLLADVLTGVTNSITTLIGVLGPAAPLLAVAGIGKFVAGTGTGKSYLAREIPTSLANLFTPSLLQQRLAGASVGGGGLFRTVENEQLAGRGLFGLQAPGLIRSAETGAYQRASYFQFFSQLLTILNGSYNQFFARLGGIVGKLPLVGGRVSGALGGIGAAGIGGLVGPAIVSGSAALQGEWQKAGVSMAGGLLGAMSGNPLLALVGSIMASAFYDQFLSYEGDLKQRWAEIFIEAQRQAQGESNVDESTRAIDEVLSENLSAWENITVGGFQLVLRASQIATSIVAGLAGEAKGPTFTKIAEGAEGFGPITKEDILTLFALEGKLSPENTKLILDALSEQSAKLISSSLEATRLEEIRGVEAKAISALAASTAQGLVEEALENIGQNVAGSVQGYLDAKQLASKLESAVSQFLTANVVLTERGVIPQLPSRETAISTYAGATEDERKVLAQLAESITDLQKEEKGLLEIPLSERTEENTKRIQELGVAINNTGQELVRFFGQVQQGTQVRDVEDTILGTIDLPEGVPAEQLPEILQKAESYWREFFDAWGISDEDADAYIDAQKRQLIRINGEVTDFFTEIPQEFIDKAIGDLGLSAGFEFIDLRDKLTQAQLPDLLSRYSRIFTAFQQLPGFTPEFTETNLILEDGFSTVSVDLRLLNLALQDLIEVEKEKGIEGIFNLPEGATFYVPVTAFELDQATRARAGGGGSYFPEDLFSAFAENPEALQRALGIWQPQEPETLLGTPLELLRQIISENITSRAEREKLGVTGPATTLPVEELRKYLESLGLSTAPSKDDRIISLNSDRNTTLNSIDSEVQKFNSGLQTLDTTMRNIQGLLAKPLGTAEEEEARRFRPPFPGGSGLELDGTGTTPTRSIIDRIKEWWDNLEKRPLLPVHPEDLIEPQTFRPTVPSSEIVQPQPISTRLNLEMESNIQLIVDGRTLANVIKPYLYEDLLRYESTGSVAIRRSILA